MSMHRPAPVLIAMKGHPATGKSLLARALAQHFGWPLIDKDDIKDHTLPLENGNTLAYSIMWQVAETQLRLKLSVIAVSPLSYPSEYETALNLAIRQGAKLLVVETRLNEAVWRRRLEERSVGASSHKIRGWRDMQKQLESYDDCWRYPIDPAHHLVVDTTRPVEGLVALVERRIFDIGV